MRHALSGRSDSRVQNLWSFASKTLRPALAACVLAGVATTAALAQQYARLPTAARPSAVYGAAKPIRAWTTFCERHAAECAADTAEPEIIELTGPVWTLITSTNRKVNKRIQAATDQDHWGLVDRWDFPSDGKGDCEDYQLLKRKLLIDSGLPRRAMRMTVVIDEEGQGHAVMMLRTNRGDFVLDNKRDAVLPWDQTPYTYIKRESETAMGWVSLGGVVSPTATANR